jgi:hypothetical protein
LFHLALNNTEGNLPKYIVSRGNKEWKYNSIDWPIHYDDMVAGITQIPGTPPLPTLPPNREIFLDPRDLPNCLCSRLYSSL